MPIQLLQPFITAHMVASAIGFSLLTDFNAILISAAILLSRIVFETVRRSIVIAREAFNHANVTSSFVFPEERRLFVRVTHAHFNRPDVSLAV